MMVTHCLVDTPLTPSPSVTKLELIATKTVLVDHTPTFNDNNR